MKQYQTEIKKPNRIMFILIAVMMLPFMAGQQLMAYTDHRNTKTDSAEQVLNSGKHLTDKERMDCYYELVRGFLGKDTRKHDFYCHQMLALTYKMDALNMRESALYHLGLQHYGQDDYKKAEEYFIRALAVVDTMRNEKRYNEGTIDDDYSQLYGALGNLYNIQDKALLAIEYYQKALPIFEKHGWLESQCILHHNLAELYLSMGNYEKAEHHYLLAQERGYQAKDSLMMVMPRKGLVKIYLSQGDYEKVRSTIEPAYAYYHAHRDEENGDYSEILSSMVKMHLMSGHENLKAAKKFASEALSLAEGELMTEIKCDIYAAACMTAMRENNWQQALEYGLKSIHEDDESATLGDTGCYEMLAVIYMHLGNLDEAQKYIKKVRAMMEQYATSHYQSGLSQMEVIYETNKKQEAITRLKREKQWLIWGGVLLVAVLLLLAVVFYLLWRSVSLSKKHDMVMAKLNGEIAERVRISRDLHDRLGGMLTAIRQNIDMQMHLSDDERAGESGYGGMQTALRLTDDAIREMRNVAHHLLPDSLRRYGLRVALRDFCQSMKNVSFSFTGEEKYINKRHEEALYCIANELVNNAVKNAQASHIQVQLMADETNNVVNVSDNGVGMPADNTGNGMGMQNIRERVASIGGVLTCYSKAGEGTEINVEVKNQ